MEKPDCHILVCAGFRMKGDAQGACSKKDAPSLIQYLHEETLSRGINAVVSATACLNMCVEGPVMVLHPHNLWYGKVDTDLIDEVLDAIEAGSTCERNLIS
jgi:(2Fe-2S) ferredoxin